MADGEGAGHLAGLAHRGGEAVADVGVLRGHRLGGGVPVGGTLPVVVRGVEVVEEDVRGRSVGGSEGVALLEVVAHAILVGGGELGGVDQHLGHAAGQPVDGAARVAHAATERVALVVGAGEGGRGCGAAALEKRAGRAVDAVGGAVVTPPVSHAEYGDVVGGVVRLPAGREGVVAVVVARAGAIGAAAAVDHVQAHGGAVGAGDHIADLNDALGGGGRVVLADGEGREVHKPDGARVAVGAAAAEVHGRQTVHRAGDDRGGAVDRCGVLRRRVADAAAGVGQVRPAGHRAAADCHVVRAEPHHQPSVHRDGRGRRRHTREHRHRGHHRHTPIRRRPHLCSFPNARGQIGRLLRWSLPEP